MEVVRALVIGLLAACGRVDFDPVTLVEQPDGDIDALVIDDAEVDGPAGPDAAPGMPVVRQRRLGFGFSGTQVTLRMDVLPGSALVAIALSQEMPTLSITDSLGHTWTKDAEVVSGMTGSKVFAWHQCSVTGGPDTVTVTPSFDNGPVHVAVVEIANASSACFDQMGTNVGTAPALEQNVITDGPLASNGQVVVAGFGAWLDEVAYTGGNGDMVSVSARPTPPAPAGDTLALVTSTRDATTQTVLVTADHATLYAAVVISIR
jgi:hypothetical protein